MRRAQPGDWAALRAVRLAALADAPQAFGSTTAREQGFGEDEWRRRVASAPTFIAWRADEPVGLVAVVGRPQDGPGPQDGPAPRDGPAPVAEWELVSMWVSPDARGSGAADLLVSAAVDAARAESAQRVVLWVADGNARARAFYVRAGFRVVGIWQTFTRQDGSSFEEEKLVMPLAVAG